MEIRVKITPKVKHESIEILSDGRYHVSVKADRKEGLANARMKLLLAQHFGVDEKSIALIAGHTSPTKTVRVSVPRGVDTKKVGSPKVL
jgi:uncharacterized protein YggU (UPF0235/DUF167 family)